MYSYISTQFSPVAITDIVLKKIYDDLTHAGNKRILNQYENKVIYKFVTVLKNFFNVHNLKYYNQLDAYKLHYNLGCFLQWCGEELFMIKIKKNLTNSFPYILKGKDIKNYLILSGFKREYTKADLIFQSSYLSIYPSLKNICKFYTVPDWVVEFYFLNELHPISPIEQNYIITNPDVLKIFLQLRKEHIEVIANFEYLNLLIVYELKNIFNCRCGDITLLYNMGLIIVNWNNDKYLIILCYKILQNFPIKLSLNILEEHLKAIGYFKIVDIDVCNNIYNQSFLNKHPILRSICLFYFIP